MALIRQRQARELLEQLAAVFGPPHPNGAGAPERLAARRLLETMPSAETPAEPRAAWWELAEALARNGREPPPGCANGHHSSELAWHADKRSTNGGSAYCRACRREERRERGWS